jgi:DNA-binding NtrC family response regulator
MERVQPLVLIVDDDAAMRAMLERFVRQQGFDVMTFPDGKPALAMLPSIRPDVALVDLQMPEVGGLEVLTVMRQAAPDCRVVLMTGEPSVETAIQAVKLGALDYLSKPFKFDRVRELLATVGQGIEQREVVFEAESALAARVEFCGMIGRSSIMQDLFDTIRRLAPHVRNALVVGETGTGKELVANALHQLGPRRHRRFVSFNCSAIVETLFESEFFGHTRGAFTGATDARAGLFEQADEGTLFLDEIGELPLPMQAKLLRVVEYGEMQRVGSSTPRKVDVQIVAATNRNLADEVREKRFREDLYYRLNVAEIVVPPLRERRDDIRLLVAAFVKQFAKRFNKPIAGVTPAAERLLQQAPWPGNVRELRNTLERACMLSDGRMLGERDIVAALGTTARAVAEPEPPTTAEDTRPAEAPDITREAIEQALREEAGNRSAAARRLGLSRRAFYRRLETFGLH